jgi:hypothetical protein
VEITEKNMVEPDADYAYTYTESNLSGGKNSENINAWVGTATPQQWWLGCGVLPHV